MKTLSDYDFKGKRVFVRPDLNCPYDEKTGKIEKSLRIIEHAKSTIRELSEKGAKVILLAHQGRRGDPDCISLKQHVKFLEEEIGKQVLFVPDTCGDKAKQAISSLKNGQILLLENVRFLEDETKYKTIPEYAGSTLAKNLLPLCDAFVLDGFSVSHRAQASVVGFSSKPTFAGRVMEKELNALSKVKNPVHPCTFILGGAKPEDSISLLEYWLSSGKMDNALCGGILGSMLILSSGKSLGKTEDFLKEKGCLQYIPKLQELLKKYPGKIKFPQDIAYSQNGKRKECGIEKLPVQGEIFDIGKKTQEEFAGLINSSKTAVINGPVGVYEREEFCQGTKAVLQAIANSGSFSLAGGGHTLSAIGKFRINKKKFSYISLAGKALIDYLSGHKLPGVEVLG